MLVPEKEHYRHRVVQFIPIDRLATAEKNAEIKTYIALKSGVCSISHR